jgi:type IV pilus assembly protein PilY1
MQSFVRRFRHVATGALLATFVSLPVVAEDSEIYVNAGTGQDAQPNVLFVIDSSGSMADPVSSTGLSRLQTVKDVAISLTQQLTGVNLGVMQYNSNSEGGFVMQPVADIGNAAHRTNVVNSIDALSLTSIQGTFTPLSETYYEAFLYFTGGRVDYGANSINTARLDADQNFYKSPISHQCQKNYIVYLTDGIPTRDIGANTEARIQGLLPPDACPLGTNDDTTDPANGACADELAAYMSDENRDLMTGVDGTQNILTYMIGFGGDVPPSAGFDIDDVAAAGGTDASFTALDGPQLRTTLQDIFRNLQSDRGTFVTPAVSVDAFNRAQTANELFFSLFKATGRTHWAGNLKKYGISDTGQIIDATGAPAVVGGFFGTGVQSIWSATADAGDVEAGGAASRIKQPNTRNLYTSIAGADLTDPDNALVAPAVGAADPDFTDLMVGTGASDATCSVACREAILWARGDDVTTAAAGDFVRKVGDPLHGQPAVVTYGNYDATDDEAEPDTYIFMPTNDGMLHAFDGRDSANGNELWAYIPPELLNRLGPLRTNGFTATRTFGLDGDVRVLKLDKNGNGVIEVDDDADVSDRVWLFFGMRSGGNRYYALDVTVPTAPKLLWNIGPETLPGIGLTWSPPVVARVNVTGTSGNDDNEKVVLIFGGGYDYTQETQTYATDPTGNRIFMVDASTGRLLWYAGGGFDAETPPDPAPNLPLITSGRSMDNAIPGRITVLDHNGDGFADRMYAGDMGGRIWRFDILNGSEPDLLVRGGIFAALGNGSVTGGTDLTNRRFYNAPDVSLVRSRGEPSYYNIAIGSGYRGHPLDRTTVERFYSLRDMEPFAVYPQTTYNTRAFIIDDDTLFDVSLDPAGSTVNSESKGWKYTLNRNGGGEKVLAEATTVDGVILFPTYEPVDPSVANPCAPSSINRVYALTAFAGKPAINFNTVGTVNQPLNNADVFTNLGQQGIVGAINVALLRGNDTGGSAPRTVCLAGVEVLSRCVDIGGTVRTYWQRNDVP